jgi:hypothetical protein
MQLTSGERCQFFLAESRKQQGLVDQRTFPANEFKPFSGFRPKLGKRFAFAFTPMNGHVVKQWPLASYFQQANQFGLVHRMFRLLGWLR